MFGCEYTIWNASVLLILVFRAILVDAHFFYVLSADFLEITLCVQIDLFKHFREDVSLRLWNSDFKRQIDGIELLQKVRN